MSLRIGKPKPKFQIKVKSSPVSTFSDRELIKEAIEVSEKLNAAYSGRVSGETALREVMSLARYSRQQLDELRKALADGTPGLDHSRASVGRIKRELLHARKLNAIPKDGSGLTARLRHWCRGATEELAPYRASLLTLLAVAISETIEAGRTDLYGDIDSSADLGKDVEALKARQQELFAAISTSITMDDIDAGSYSQGRTTPATFKGTGVPIAPPDTAGQRLVAYLLSQRT